mmetsp:Transcript_3636/g.5374  ORF Transcript_3636/g.5374 Transcript_3636/m.5374 type:complete len:177 (-) Transcript_3636:10-540(-)
MPKCAFELSTIVVNPPTYCTKKSPIQFYGKKLNYFEFSNFYLSPIVVNGKSWKTTEHYFQAAKFPNHKAAGLIRKATTPSKAASLGRSREYPLRMDWEQVKDRIMYDAVYAKFTQHDDLKKVLLGTGNRHIIEASPRDAYWGWGKDGKGKNQLGITLMQVRERIRDEEKKNPLKQL